MARNTRNSVSASTAPFHTDIVCIADRSGSMYTMEGSIGPQISNIMNEQKESSIQNNSSIHFSLVSFDDQKTTCIDSAPIGEIPCPRDVDLENWLSPRGTTRLVDTILEEIENQNTRVQEYKADIARSVRALDPEIKRIVMIITDGVDNRSVHTEEELNRKVTEATKNNSVFIFLAANQDAIQTGGRFGIDSATSMTIGNDRQTSAEGLRHASAMMRCVSDGSPASPVFSINARMASAPNAVVEGSDDDDDDDDLFLSPLPPPLYRIVG